MACARALLAGLLMQLALATGQGDDPVCLAEGCAAPASDDAALFQHAQIRRHAAGAAGNATSSPFTYSTTTTFNDFGHTWPGESGPRFHHIATWGELNPPNDISDQGFKDASGATVTKVASVLPFAIPYPMALKVGKTRAGFIKEVVASATGSGKAVGCYLAQKLSPDTNFIPRNIGQRTSQELADAKVDDGSVYLMVPAQFCGGNCWTADATASTDCQNTCGWITDVYADDSPDAIGKKCETNTDPNCAAFCVAATGKPNGASTATWPDMAEPSNLANYIAHGSCNPPVGLTQRGQSDDCQWGEPPSADVKGCYKYPFQANYPESIVEKVENTAAFGRLCQNEFAKLSEAHNQYLNQCTGANLHMDFAQGSTGVQYRVKPVPCDVAGSIDIGTAS